QALDNAAAIAQVVHQRTGLQAIQLSRAHTGEQPLTKARIEARGLIVKQLQALAPQRIGQLGAVQLAHFTQAQQQMATQFDISSAQRRVGCIELPTEVLLQMLGILDRVHQLQRSHLTAQPELLPRLVQVQFQAPHETQQVAIDTLDVSLIERVGVKPVRLDSRLQQR